MSNFQSTRSRATMHLGSCTECQIWGWNFPKQDLEENLGSSFCRNLSNTKLLYNLLFCPSNHSKAKRSTTGNNNHIVPTNLLSIKENINIIIILLFSYLSQPIYCQYLLCILVIMIVFSYLSKVNCMQRTGKGLWKFLLLIIKTWTDHFHFHPKWNELQNNITASITSTKQACFGSTWSGTWIGINCRSFSHLKNNSMSSDYSELLNQTSFQAFISICELLNWWKVNTPLVY